MVKSLLGADRTRTELRLGSEIRATADRYSDLLDVPLNVVFTLAMAHFAVSYSRLITHSGRRKQVVSAMEAEFLRILEEVKTNS